MQPIVAGPSDVSIRIATTAPEVKKVQTLLREYTEHLYTFIDPLLLQHRAGETSETPAAFMPPSGTLLLATHGEQPLGCAGIRNAGISGEEKISELCRLFVTPAGRGLSLGWALTQAALAIARERKDKAVVLYSIEGFMDPAKKIYLRAGFRPIAPYKKVSMSNVGFLSPRARMTTRTSLYRKGTRTI
ncbi:MAG: GNAT family N-acetyltransferase [Acidobacteriaceae bacterium]|nr:GNAT family N-acetyltransferase [Acidobacteriaceae bacterium]